MVWFGANSIWRTLVMLISRRCNSPSVELCELAKIQRATNASSYRFHPIEQGENDSSPKLRLKVFQIWAEIQPNVIDNKLDKNIIFLGPGELNIFILQFLLCWPSYCYVQYVSPSTHDMCARQSFSVMKNSVQTRVYLKHLRIWKQNAFPSETNKKILL